MVGPTPTKVGPTTTTAKWGNLNRVGAIGGQTQTCVGTTRWMCAGGTSASTRISVPGAMAPIQGTNVPTNIDFTVKHNQNGGQNDNVPFPEIDPDFAPQIPPLINNFVPPTTYEQIPTAPQAKVREGQASPHHMESPAQASSSVPTPHTSRPGMGNPRRDRDHVALSSPHALIHNASFPLGNNKGPPADYDMPNLALPNKCG
jgi:hypothetical protein